MATLTESGYQAALETAAWMDLSERGRLKVSGADSTRFLHGQCTNEIVRLKAGQGCYATCLTSKGKMRGDFVALVFEGHLLLDTEPMLRESLTASLLRYVIAEDVVIEDVTAATGMLTLCGPQRFQLLESLRAGSVSPSDLAQDYSHKHVGDLIVVRSVRTRRGDVDLIGPRDLIQSLREKLRLTAPELDEQAREALRVEAGIPLFGSDMDENTIPTEAGLEDRAISYNKGCYIGQETVSRIKSIGHVNRHLVGLRLDSAALPARGEKLLAEGVEIGYITTPVVSPRLGALALGYVRRGFEQPGTRVSVAGVEAIVSCLPFAT